MVAGRFEIGVSAMIGKNHAVEYDQSGQLENDEGGRAGLEIVVRPQENG